MQRPKKNPLAKILALALTLAMLLGIAVTASAATYPDVAGHWGETAIEKWSAYDVLHGNDLGTFDPDGELDVTQLSQILVNTFGYTESFSGALPGYTSTWGEEAVRKAVAAGAIEASEAALPLTRELAAKIVAKAFGIAPVSGASKFSDDYAISSEYKPYAAALGRAGIFNGNDYGEFMPSSVFSRAQIMQALDNAVTDIVKEGKAAESAKSVIINKGGVTLTEGTINGDLIIAQGVGDGDITLDGVTIKGRLVIFGGGVNSIHVKGKSSIANVTIAKTFGQAARFVVESADAAVGTVTVIAESKATVATTNGAEIAKIEVAPATEVSAAGEVEAAAVTAATTVTISAKAAAVEIAAENAALTISSGATITSLTVETKAAVTVASGATVTAATIEASDVKLSGAGKVTNVTVTENAKTGVEVKTSGTKVTVAADAGSVTTSTGKVDAGKSSTTTGSSSNTSNDSGIGGGGAGGGTDQTTTVTIGSPVYTFDGAAFSGVTISCSVENGSGDTAAIANAEDYAAVVSGNTVTVAKKTDATTPTDAGTDITVTITNHGVTKTATFTVVEKEFARPTGTEETYKVAALKADGAVKLQSGTNFTDSTWYYAATGSDVYKIFDAIYTPNKDLTGAVELFHITLGANSTNDKIEVKGTTIPQGTQGSIKEIQIGIPGADNSLPDFIIPPGALGASSATYSYTRLVVNNGVYLNIDSDQKIDTLGSATPTAGNFIAGNITVKSGGKLRDGAYSDWPLGDNSTLAIEAGGYLAVGPGNKDGQYQQRSNTSVSSDPFEHGMNGWLIGPKDDDDTLSRVQLGKTDYASSQIWVAKDWVYLTDGSYAKVAQYANVYPYNILVGQGSIVEIAAELDTLQGSTQAKFYGSPNTVPSATPEPAKFAGGTVIIATGGTVSGVALGQSSGNITSAAIYYCASGATAPPTATAAPWDSAKSFVCNWSVATQTS
ncbi:MAG: S-layer homology domain-containing protein [Oscillospiraceae bacterium]|jgi:hypothetical protein|nr:S-layer homology domain-containing protein [Oscillospiraceae bacterium]